MHQAASDGYERHADTYASARPDYAVSTVAKMLACLGGGLSIDLGAGTGIATEALVASGRSVLAVEPVAAMRSQLAQRLPEVKVVDGTAQQIPVADGVADSVVAAQAFHWFEPVPALDEIDRVLTHGGVLATLWNVRDQSVPWVAAYTEIVDEYGGDAPRAATMAWRRAIEDDGRFVVDQEFGEPNPWPTTADGVIDRALSTSFVAALSPADQAVVSNRLRSVVEGLGDAFPYPYRTEAQVWRRSG